MIDIVLKNFHRDTKQYSCMKVREQEEVWSKWKQWRIFLERTLESYMISNIKFVSTMIDDGNDLSYAVKYNFYIKITICQKLEI